MSCLDREVYVRRIFFFSIAVAFLLLVNVTYAQDLLFAPAVNYGVGINPHAIFAADLDGDGDNDLATANNLSDDVSILMNNGNGTFQAAVDYRAGTTPNSVVAVDLDSDGDKDLAVANWGSDNVSILLNNGDGTFQAPVNYGAGSNPIRISAADLDGDSDNDLAVANYSSENVSILLNTGTGTFQEAVNHWAGRGVCSSFAVDLDGDGDKDLAVTNGFMYNYNVLVLLNDGDGTFQRPVYYGAGSHAWSIFAADLDGDGDNDLAVPNQGSNNVSILMNKGNATFVSSVQYEVGIGPTAVFAADLDGDEDKELAVVHEYSDSLWILENTGNGTFQLGAKYGTGREPTEVFSVDLDGDGYNDLAVANKLPGNVSILINCSFASSTWHVAVDGSDLTGDGSEQYPFATIQHGVDSATTRDTVLVHPGTYTGLGNRDIDFGGEYIVLKSVVGPEETIVDCQGTQSEPHRGFRFHSGENHYARVEGFTITNGYAPEDDTVHSDLGTLVYAHGGGIFCDSASSPTIKECRIINNHALWKGYGSGGDGGGGIYCYKSSPVLEDNMISGNSSGNGGGVALSRSSAHLVQNVITGNHSLHEGGGIALNGSNDILVSNTVSGNSAVVGGGVWLNGASPSLERCIIALNVGGSLVCSGSGNDPVLTYCDIYDSGIPSWPSCVSGQLGQNGNISGDPLFCDAANSDYHISGYSPCAPANNYWDGTLIGALYPNCGTLFCGDANMDGQLTSADVELLQAYYFFQTPPDLYVPVGAVDMDCSGRISLNDLIMLAGYLYGYGPTPCCALPPPPPKRPELPTPDFDAGGPMQ